MASTPKEMLFFREICDSASEGLMVTTDLLKIVYVNKAFEITTGYQAEEVKNHPPSILSSGFHDRTFYQEMWTTIIRDGRWQGLIWNRRKNGKVYPEWLTIKRLKNGMETYYAGYFSDLSAFENIRNDLRRFACYDHLTELPNRALFEDMVTTRLRQSERRQTPCGLLFADIDYFKRFNDVYGHSFGDRVIQGVASRLKSLMREGDVLARFAGDEFVALIDECPDLRTLNRICRRITQGFASPLMLEGEACHVSLSVGSARSSQDGADYETLLRNADRALYAAKENGRGQALTFSRRMFGPVNRANLVATTLQQDLTNSPDSFSVLYQPQFELASGRMVGLEALIRWKSPKLGSVNPAEFISVAETQGLIQPLTERLVQQVLTDIKGVPAPALAGLTLCLNVSALQIPNACLLPVLAPLQAECYRRGLDGGIELEITETQLVRQNEQFPNGLENLRKAGFSIAIDDFGTGYSSLGYLRRLPVDTLKIDRCFIRESHRNREDRAIIRAIIAMAQGLTLKIVAEGIERPEQVDLLRKLGCMVGQGYLLARPTPLSRVLKLNEPGPAGCEWTCGRDDSSQQPAAVSWSDSATTGYTAVKQRS